MRPHRFEHAQRARDVGLDKGLGAADRAVDMALGRQIGDGIDALGIEHYPRPAPDRESSL